MKKNTYLNKASLPGSKDLEKLAKKALFLSRHESLWRPLTEVQTPGTLIDFINPGQNDALFDVIVIPDLHGRTSFLKNLLDFKIPEGDGKDLSIEEALSKNKIHLVFLGDALHTEFSTKDRWFLAKELFEQGDYASEPMKQEMAEGLSVYITLLDLLCKYPNNFFFLRGNHENIKNKNDDGMFSFKKYAYEGEMTSLFMEHQYGQHIRDLLENFEDALPLVYAGNRCVISHAEPYAPFDRDSMIHGHFLAQVMNGLTWTNNDVAAENAVELSMAALLGHNNAVWISGHRPVCDGYHFQRNGLFLQIHDPRSTKVLFVSKDRSINIETDFWEVTPPTERMFS